MGRFLQPDSLIPDLYNPVSLDRYAYSRNNPINYNDPTGHMSSAFDDGNSSGCPARTCYIELIGSMNGNPPYSTGSLGPNAEESFTNDQPVNPDVSDKSRTVKSAGSTVKESAPSAAVTAIDGINQSLIGGLNQGAYWGKDEIFVWASYKVNNVGTKTFDALTVINTANTAVKVNNVSFKSSGSPFCSNTCVYSSGGEYTINNSTTSKMNFYIPKESTTTASLIPSEFPYNPTNAFRYYESVKITVIISERSTGKLYPFAIKVIK